MSGREEQQEFGIILLWLQLKFGCFPNPAAQAVTDCQGYFGSHSILHPLAMLGWILGWVLFLLLHPFAVPRVQEVPPVGMEELGALGSRENKSQSSWGAGLGCPVAHPGSNWGHWADPGAWEHPCAGGAAGIADVPTSGRGNP